VRLNVGCGGGAYPFVPLIEGKDVVHADIDFRGMARGLNLVKCDAQQMPFKAGSMTEVVASHLIEHLERPEFLLEESHRILGDDGILRLKTPNFLSDNARRDETHRQFYNYFTLNRLLKEHGFRASFKLNIMSQFRLLEVMLSALIIPFLHELDATATKS